MEIFKQNQLLKRSVGVLVILNLVLLIIVFLNPSRPEKNREGNNNERLILTLKKELSLSNEQCERIRTVRNDFFQEENRIREVVRVERDSINELIFSDSVNVSKANSLAIKISNYMYEMESLRIQQAQEIMKICTLEQRRKFKSFHREIKDYFKPIKNEEKPPRSF